MNKTLNSLALVATLIGGTAFAQSNNATDVQRDANQQQRIEQGLQSGELNTKEAGKLENQQQHVDKMEQRADRNGSISPAEQQRINAAQNRASANVYGQKHDAQTGHPNSASSQRMQADVQRSANQQQRTANGIRNGTVTNREAGSLERGQAHVNGAEARNAADGHVGAAGQARIQGREDRQSARVFNQKHNFRNRG